MKIAVLAITKGGMLLADSLARQLECHHLLTEDQGISVTLAKHWSSFDGFVCIMASGVVVRAVAPLLRDKLSDPCVLVMDEKAQHVVSLLSGHLGGGNQLAYRVAKITSARPVITTASDVRGLVALDLWAATQNLIVSDRQKLTQASSLLVNRGKLKIHCQVEVKSLPAGLVLVDDEKTADLLISNRRQSCGRLVFHPLNLVVGVGCNRGTPVVEFEDSLSELFSDLNLSTHSIRNIASINVKNDEKGLLEFAEKKSLAIEFFAKEDINRITAVDISDAALRAVGAIGVAEPTALISAQSSNLLSRKRKWQNITMAIAEAPFLLSAQVQGQENT